MKERIVLSTLLSIMAKKNMNRSVLAFQSDIKISRLSRIINGWDQPNQVEMDKIAEVLKASPRKIFNEVG